MKHLVISDSHSAADELNHRYIRLAKFIIGTKPDKIIHLGDWASMDSLNLFDTEETRPTIFWGVSDCP